LGRRFAGCGRRLKIGGGIFIYSIGWGLPMLSDFGGLWKMTDKDADRCRIHLKKGWKICTKNILRGLKDWW